MTNKQISELKAIPLGMEMAALLAYQCVSAHHYGSSNGGIKQQSQAAINCASFACSLAKVSDEIQLDITSGKIKGLKNLAKLSGAFYYESDYQF